jgi:hypothetical protein
MIEKKKKMFALGKRTFCKLFFCQKQKKTIAELLRNKRVVRIDPTGDDGPY